jgi:hypothetical protein
MEHITVNLNRKCINNKNHLPVKLMVINIQYTKCPVKRERLYLDRGDVERGGNAKHRQNDRLILAI